MSKLLPMEIAGVGSGLKSESSSDLAPLRVGIAGLGRSGWGIHAEAIAKQAGRFAVVAVADDQPARRAEAGVRFACRAYATVDGLLTDPAVELVVIATPNHLHAQHAIAALEAGKHVLCEKPMASTPDEAAAMIAASRRAGRLLTVFNNRRFDPHYLKVREIVQSGALGRIVQVRLVAHAFTRRWDWQTLKEFGGGMLNNIGAHFLDLLLPFLPAARSLPSVFCHLDRVLTLGDADDHCVVMLRNADGSGPLLQMELTNACMLPQDNWLILGDRGTLSGNFDSFHWRVLDADKLPVRTLERTPSSSDRTYNRDPISWAEHQWTVPPAQSSHRWQHQQFYDRLYGTLRHGEPLVVTPEQVQRCLHVISAAHAAAGTAVQSPSGPPTPTTTAATAPGTAATSRRPLAQPT